MKPLGSELDVNVNEEIVSSEAEPLILVDSDDQELGFLDKGTCHDGEGVLHRAFSLFIFNPQGQVLLQQRAAGKRLWPHFWSNSCCSHPRRGESMQLATERRCQQELGFSTQLQFVYKFEYSAKYEDIGSERELCSVFIGTLQDSLSVNQTEIQNIKWLWPDDLDQSMNTEPSQYTPWFAQEWRTLRTQYSHLLPG